MLFSELPKLHPALLRCGKYVLGINQIQWVGTKKNKLYTRDIQGMSYYYAALGYEGAKTKRVSTTFALCSHALKARTENYGESTGGKWRTLSDSQGQERRKSCA
jgi:hypothetical protein